MFIYHYSIFDEEGASHWYLGHDTIGPDEFEKLVAEVEQSLIPIRIAEKKEWMPNYYKKALNACENGVYGSDKDDMRKYILDKRDGDHEIGYHDVVFDTARILISQYGFYDFTFSKEVSRRYFDPIATFKLDSGV